MGGICGHALKSIWEYPNRHTYNFYTESISQGIAQIQGYECWPRHNRHPSSAGGCSPLELLWNCELLHPACFLHTPFTSMYKMKLSV